MERAALACVLAPKALEFGDDLAPHVSGSDDKLAAAIAPLRGEAGAVYLSKNSAVGARLASYPEALSVAKLDGVSVAFAGELTPENVEYLRGRVEEGGKIAAQSKPGDRIIEA